MEPTISNTLLLEAIHELYETPPGLQPNSEIMWSHSFRERVFYIHTFTGAAYDCEGDRVPFTVLRIEGPKLNTTTTWLFTDSGDRNNLAPFIHLVLKED